MMISLSSLDEAFPSLPESVAFGLTVVLEQKESSTSFNDKLHSPYDRNTHRSSVFAFELPAAKSCNGKC